MFLKKFLLFGLIAAVLPAVAEEGADRKTATSLKYVTHELDTRQDKFTAEQNKAMEYTNAAGTVQKRAVKSDLGTSTSDTSLPMVGGVNTKLNRKQDDIDPVNDHTAVTYTGQPGGIGRKGIYQTTESYAAQSDNLIDAKTFNAALKKGLDSEFICSESDPNTNLCWVYSIHNVITDNTLLPDDYTPLGYLQSDGTQYINTGIYPADLNTNSEFFIDVQYVDGNAAHYNYASAFGAQAANFWLKTDVKSATMIGIQAGASATETKITVASILDRHQIKWNTGLRKCYMDNVEYNLNVTNGVFTSITNQITLFKSNIGIGGGPNTYAKAKIYGAYIKSNDILVRNFIPAQNAQGTIGMYDTVSGNFFENAGNGADFIAGPIIPDNIYIPQNQ